ncbi:hypothetical protein ACFYXL_14525 [Streptomyces tsukubensis]|uniref:hypothetical protein n=1 Tax=Streptomyces tsukubensis TaxID=83656 RepID=UPI003694D632
MPDLRHRKSARGRHISVTRHTKRWGVALAAVTVLTVTGLTLNLATGGPVPEPAGTPSVSPKAQPGSTSQRGDLVHGVPTGHPRTEVGAKAAAGNYVIVSNASIFASKKTRDRALAVVTSRDARARVAEQAEPTADRLPSASKSQVVARTGVLSATVLGFDIHKATIRLWTTTVRGNTEGAAPPRADFQSVTISLVWEDNDWKVDSTARTSGLVTPVDVRQTTSASSDFSDYTSKAANDPVFSGTVESTGLPSAYERDERGAHAAATSSVMLYGDSRFFSDTAWRHRMLEATTASSVLDAVTADADSTARLVVENRGLDERGRTADGGLLVTRTAVLGTRTVSFSDQAASVELWTASVGGVAGSDETQRPQIGFLRMTVDLTWTDGDWKTTAVTPGEPLVPSFAPAVPASPGHSFTAVGGETHAPALA